MPTSPNTAAGRTEEKLRLLEQLFLLMMRYGVSHVTLQDFGSFNMILSPTPTKPAPRPQVAEAPVKEESPSPSTPDPDLCACGHSMEVEHNDAGCLRCVGCNGPRPVKGDAQ